MKVLLYASIFLLTALRLPAQDVKELQETAKTFMKQGDFPNAILVLNRAYALEPANLSVAKDLSLANYYQNDLARAYSLIKPVVENDAADDQSFQIAGNILRAQANPKEAEKVYRKGLKKFPASGALYNDLGELMWSQKNYEAIAQWEKGIESDPAFSRNYYNAARHYYFSTDRTWSLLYGEIFLNMEPFGPKSAEIKEILLEGYKKLFSDTDMLTGAKQTSAFGKAYLEAMAKQSPLVAHGITPEVLTMVRTRFILEWQSNYAKNFPYKLFELHEMMLKDGLFNAYNQWIFGAAQNLAAFQSWVNAHPEEYASLTKFQRSTVFKMPENQYYK